MLRRLAIFAGGFSLGAADALVGDGQAEGSDVLHGLTGLVDKSLLQAAAATYGEPRFVMLETIREFALERLEAAGELETLRTQHLLYYVALADEAEPKLFGAEQEHWFSRLTWEHDNIRAAPRWALESRETDLGLHLGGALWWFLLLHPYLGEQREQLTALLAQPDAPGRDTGPVRAKALVTVGALAWAWGDLAAARGFLREGLERSRVLGEKWGVSMALTGLGHVARVERDYARAQGLYEEALVVARQAADRRLVMFDVYNLGVLRHIQGNHHQARSFLEESLAIAQQVGDSWTLAASLANLGHTARADGDFASARQRYQESLANFRQIGDWTSIAYSLAQLGMLALDEGDADAARSPLAESLAMYRDVSNRRFMAVSLEGLAGVAAARGRADCALRLAGVAATLRVLIARPCTATEQVRLNHWLEPARRQLGEAASAAAWVSGQALPLERAVAEALGS